MTNTMDMILLESIEFNTEPLRQTFNMGKLAELRDSILERGVIQPIIVKKTGEKFALIIGERRLRAAKLAGFSKIPAIIENNIDRKDALELALIENMQREDLTPFEEGFAVIKLMRDHNYTIEEAAKKTGLSALTIRSRIKLVSLPKEVQKHVISGKLPIKQALPLAKLKSPRSQIMQAEKIIKEILPLKAIKQEIKQQTEKQRCVTEKQQNFEKALMQIKRARKSLLINHRDFSVEKFSEIRKEIILLKEQLEKTIAAIDEDLKKLDQRKKNAK